MPKATRRIWIAAACLAAFSVYWLLSSTNEDPPKPEYSPIKKAERGDTPARSSTTQPIAGGENKGTAGGQRAAPAAPSDVGASAGLGTKFGFQMPPTARVGEAVDLNVAIDTRQDLGRVRIEVRYDPAILRARSAEGIDYAHRRPNDRALNLDVMTDGRIVAVLTVDLGPAPRTAAVVQFEAVAPGLGQVEVENISISDRTNRTLSWTADRRTLQVAIH